MKNGMEVKGLDDFFDNLRNMGDERAIREVEERALKRGARILSSEMQRNAPVSTYNKKHLRDSIVISEIKDDKDGKPHILVAPAKEFWYAKFLEFGTIKQPSQPFVEPSVHNKTKEILDNIAEIMKDVMRLK